MLWSGFRRASGDSYDEADMPRGESRPLRLRLRLRMGARLGRRPQCPRCD